MKIDTRNLINFRVVPAIIIFLISFFILYNSPLEIYPANDTLLEYNAISDANYDSVGSLAELDTSHNSLHFTYTLSPNSENPFAWLLFHAHELARNINLKKFQNIDLDLDPNQSDDFTFTIYMYIPNFSDPELMETHRPYSMKCRIIRGKRHYHYKIKDLATPTWWFGLAGTREESIPPTDWSKMTHITISDFGTTPLGTPQAIFINRLRFTDNLLAHIIISIILSILYIIILMIIKKIKISQRKKSIKSKIYYNKYGNNKSYSPQESEILIKYLGDNYSNIMLNLELIKKDTGINAFQCNEILIDSFTMKYKQYISYIRIEEAKRLLVTSNRQINEISELVGYCYPNSFSRTFKQIVNSSPKEFRENNSK